MTKVIAVVDSARRQTRFAAGLSSAFSAAGIGLELRTHRELIAEVSIEQPRGQAPIVDPDRPLMWLSSGDAVRESTPDARFLASEAIGAARSIAMLTRSPVLNRPSAFSLCGTLPPSPALAVRRTRHLDHEGVRAERFTRTWRADDDTDVGRLEVYDYAAGRSSYGPVPSSAGPFRSRPAVDRARLVKVRVVGDRTIAATDVALVTLEASRRIVSWYQLDLAALWWLIGEDTGDRTLARIDCWAWDAGFDADLDETAEAVAAWMSDRMRPAEVTQ
ncbi:hypothetical protein J5X84_25700 [Streptosporangiaceae bacterium NEAU-GS5]|nr:hypothetical protein [Streptosporangiaceae bacterium NEAU-GS5]